DCIVSPLRAKDVAWLQRFGILRSEVSWASGKLLLDGEQYDADIHNAGSRERIIAELAGKRLTGGICLHGGFFLGPEDFYQRLRALAPSDKARIEMHRIDFINQLYGHGELARAQRRRARFMNTAMMVTLLGAAVSDGLETGQVVSGVGGQYNFVAMAHALADARSIIMLRATRESGGDIRSNILWNYGHTTIPRHLRDVVITEYGVADLRGQSDAEVVKRLICIADSRFQDELIESAQGNGKLEAGWAVPEAFRNNLPAALEARLAPWEAAGLLPDFPFGTDFTPDELAMIGVLQKLKHASENPLELVASALRGWFGDQEVPAGWLERLGLQETHDLKSLLLRRLFIGNL
ncbi:acetyl-CoA hydrolase/transferase C-terminal domain-containing protein, partial [Chitinimonas sp.]|uniref:acetyl-CoA hydrolase/transferase C-terminal domain-containing protein n=1 Tax=Chitinimonas sp. TaxID=1934313 RepID=UPI0035AF3C98